MLYLVGGCSRSGKSMLAGRMLSHHGVPWYPLDALKMGLHLGSPQLAIHPQDDDLETADRMWSIVEGMLDHLIFDGHDYLVEGIKLRPEMVARSCASLGLPFVGTGGDFLAGFATANRC